MCLFWVFGSDHHWEFAEVDFGTYGTFVDKSWKGSSFFYGFAMFCQALDHLGSIYETFNWWTPELRTSPLRTRRAPGGPFASWNPWDDVVMSTGCAFSCSLGNIEEMLCLLWGGCHHDNNTLTFENIWNCAAIYSGIYAYTDDGISTASEWVEPTEMWTTWPYTLFGNFFSYLAWSQKNTHSKHFRKAMNVMIDWVWPLPSN